MQLCWTLASPSAVLLTTLTSCAVWLQRRLIHLIHQQSGHLGPAAALRTGQCSPWMPPSSLTFALVVTRDRYRSRHCHVSVLLDKIQHEKVQTNAYLFWQEYIRTLAVILFPIFVLLDTPDIQHTATGEAQYFHLSPRFQGFIELFCPCCCVALKKGLRSKIRTCLYCPIKLAFFLTVCVFGSCFKTLSVILVSGWFT